MKYINPLFFFALFACLLIPGISFAETTTLGIDGTLDTIMKAVSGKVAYFVAFLSIVIAGMTWAASESGSMSKTGFRITIAILLIVNAPTILTTGFQKSVGLGFF